MAPDDSASSRGVNAVAGGGMASGRVIAATLAAVLLAIWVVILQANRAERQSAINDAYRATSNLARAFDEHTVRTMRAADQVLFDIKRRYEAQRQAFDLVQYFEQNRLDNTLFVNAVISDAKGDVVLASTPVTRPVNLADREHVRVHAERDSGDFVISKPVLARVARRWTIVLTRRVNAPDGSFGGVVGVAIDPQYFASYYAQVDLGRDAVVALIGRDGIERARHAGDNRPPGPGRAQARTLQPTRARCAR